MTTPLFTTLAIAAATVGSLHALAPDHWLPITAVSRARDWSLGRTARVALLCGFGHVTVSALLAFTALASGVKVIEAFGARSASVSFVLLIGFGLTYTLVGARRLLAGRLHGHDHDHFDHVHEPSRLSAWSLFLIYCADACVALIPIVFAASALSLTAALAIVAIYEVTAISTMVGLVVVSRAGAGALFGGRWTNRYGDVAAGSLIVVTGIVVAVLGW